MALDTAAVTCNRIAIVERSIAHQVVNTAILVGNTADQAVVKLVPVMGTIVLVVDRTASCYQPKVNRKNNRPSVINNS